MTLAPAGLLRERIEDGERFDLFASASMAHPLRLAALGKATDPTCFARNRFCVIARAALQLTPQTLIDRLADPNIRIGMSTPGDDPSGDYAFEVFDHIERTHPGLGADLKQRAQQLVGGRNSPSAPPGKGPGYLISDGTVDLMMAYASNAARLRTDPSFTVVEIPPAYAPRVEYGLALSASGSSGSRQRAEALAQFILSDHGQTILRSAGFLGVDDPV